MVSSQQKVLQFHISRLKDKSPEVILRTIQELVKFGAEAKEALPVLEQVYRNHEDPTVKKAAQLAGIEIYNATKAIES
jgi:hypothetical protein